MLDRIICLLSYSSGTCVGLYAKELMEYCEKIVSDRDQVSITDPVEVLNRAAANTQSSGSSTALVAYFDDRVCCHST